MKIWIDGYEANALQRLGSSQVAFELLKSLEKIDSKNDYTVLLPDPPLPDLPKERQGWKYKILKPKKLWSRIALPVALYREKPDLIFSPTHYISRFCSSSVKRVATIFDLSFLHFPEMFKKGDLWKLINWTKFSVQNADHIITISNFSKDDILKQYNLPNDKVTVAYPGYDREKFTVHSSQFTVKNYIIYIGTIQPRKNLLRLIEAVSRINNLNLVVVGKTKGEGKEGWMYEDILKAPKDFGIEDRVKFLGFVPTEELQTLLAGAIAYILPSLWEGFGIPVVEAMASGVPVIVSNASSLPEVVGKAGLLIDPYSVDQIEQAIRTITTDKKLQQQYSKAGILQAQKFSWEKMAKETLKVFEKVVS